MPNLKRALALTLAAGEIATAVDFADSIVSFLNDFGRWRERDAVMEQVDKETRRQGDKGTGRLTKAELLLESRRGETLLSQGRAAEAERVFRALLARMDAGMDYGGTEAGYHRCITLQRLGRSQRAQGKPSAAAEAYRAALAVAGKLEQDEQVLKMSGDVHNDLADVLTDLAQYDGAREQYEMALELSRKVNDGRGVAVTLGQLGTLALVQGDLAEARRRYTDALVAFRNLGEPQHQAIYLHQLGMVAETAAQRAGAQNSAPLWDEAERCYKESLALEERLGHKEGAAQTCNQLAMVAEGAGRLEDAERWYKRTLQDAELLPDQGAAVYNNLADLFLSQNRLDEAEAYAHRAREIKETLDLSSQPWNTYNILEQIAEKRGRAAEAREWRRKRDEAIAAFEQQSGGQFGAAQQAAQIAQAVQQWAPVIADIVAVCKGDKRPLQRLEPFLQKQGETDDWRNLVAVIRRILKGQRGAALAQGLDNVDAAIVGKILEGVQ